MRMSLDAASVVILLAGVLHDRVPFINGGGKFRRGADADLIVEGADTSGVGRKTAHERVEGDYDGGWLRDRSRC
jgi:hypothetical protein